MGKGGGGTTPTWSQFDATTLSAPWEEQVPYIKQMFSTAGNLAQTPIEYFPGQTIAGFAPEQSRAMTGITERAAAGSPLLGAAKGEAEKTIRGDYLNPDTNPWLRETYNRALEGAMPNLRGTAASAGRTGSYADFSRRNDLMSRMAGDIYGGNYQAERGRQVGMIDRAAPLAETDYSDLVKMYGVGAQKQAQTQSEIDAARSKWEFGEMEPWTRAANLKNLVSGNYGGTTQASGWTQGVAAKGGGK